MAQVAIGPRTETITRTQFLGELVRDLTRRLSGVMGFWYGELIRKGIVERQYISTLFISYLREERLVGRVELHIDYQRHRINLARQGELFAFDPATSAAHQASPGLEKFIAIFVKLLDVPDVTVEMSWYWTRGIDQEEAMAWMGAREGQLHRWLEGEPSTVGGSPTSRTTLEALDRIASGDSLPATAEVNHRPGGLDEVHLTGQLVLDALRGRTARRKA